MKLKSVAGLVYYVKDLKKTAAFYQKLGFTITEDKPEIFSVRINWFWIDFHPIDKKDIPDFQKIKKLEPENSGLFVYVNVEDVDGVYRELIRKGIKPDSEPQDYPWGNREFILKDPDGYKLVFFQKN